MPNPENLKPMKKGETKNPNGRPKGSKNRSTLLKYWLKTKTKIKHPETKQEVTVSLEDTITLGLIKKASSGDVAAYKEIMDTLHGKIKENIDMNIETSDLSKYTPDELAQMAKNVMLLEKAKK